MPAPQQGIVRWTTRKRNSWLRISKMRGLHTLRRRNKAKRRRRHLANYGHYPFESTDDRIFGHSPISGYELQFPKMLDLAENLQETLDFFSALRKLVDQIKPSSIRIDHSSLEKVSPGAALVLIAEVIRGVHVLPKCKWRGNKAANNEVHELLGEVGYWDYFKDMYWKKSPKNSRQYIQHQSGNQTVGPVAKQLVQHFLPEMKFPGDSRKTLYPAIIECMDNVMKHAYHIRDKGSHFYNRWWILGFRDPETHEVSFCFYDQGQGIPKTIRVRLKDAKIGSLSLISDAELIVKAVLQGYSSTQDPTRGRGLPTLKRFVDVAKSGELMIVSHKSRCIFRKNNNDELNFSAKFHGTLIIWRLQN